MKICFSNSNMCSVFNPITCCVKTTCNILYICVCKPLWYAWCMCSLFCYSPCPSLQKGGTGPQKSPSQPSPPPQQENTLMPKQHPGQLEPKSPIAHMPGPIPEQQRLSHEQVWMKILVFALFKFKFYMYFNFYNCFIKLLKKSLD